VHAGQVSIVSGRQSHWQGVYAAKSERDVSWFEETPSLSLALIAACGVARDAPIIDVGGGASRLVDALLDEGYGTVTVLDLSEAALAAAQARLAASAAQVRWVVADVTRWTQPQSYQIWHDRAAFHFLTQGEDRRSYVATLRAAVLPGGHVIIGTFAPDGPEKCSGLPVMRHDAVTLGREIGDGFELVESRRHDHVTPWGSTQRFQFSRFLRARE
jgi:2-polyprenyl-3-methyl-5-hydroxy-6-metoxy-1,4-benzoquinol methylase